MYNNNLIVLLNLLKSYSSEIETIVTDDDNEKEFGNEFISDLIENIMIDLKDLDRNLD
jgi:hypothetical protein